MFAADSVTGLSAALSADAGAESSSESAEVKLASSVMGVLTGTAWGIVNTPHEQTRSLELTVESSFFLPFAFAGFVGAGAVVADGVGAARVSESA